MMGVHVDIVSCRDMGVHVNVVPCHDMGVRVNVVPYHDMVDVHVTFLVMMRWVCMRTLFRVTI